VTDHLSAVLDRFVADQHAAVPPVAEVRRRAGRRRRRRLTVTTTAVLLTALLAGGGLWAVQTNREPGLLVVADGEARLNDWVTLTWLPADVVGAEFIGTNPEATMENFGFWQGHYRLSRGIDRPIVLHIALGDPFDVDAEVAMAVGPVVVEGDRVIVSLADGETSIHTKIGPATVQVIGNDPVAMRGVLDGMVVETPTIEIPGNPVVLASGRIDGVPWEVRVTTPDPAISPENLSANGTCLMLRIYTGGIACLHGTGEHVVTHSLFSPWENSDLIGPGWLLLTDTEAVAFEYIRPDGTTARVDAAPAAPAPGAFAVVDVGAAGPITGVRALAADGTVLQVQFPGDIVPPPSPTDGADDET
jgi:hypothetical protein